VAEGWDFEELVFDGITADYGRRRVLSRVSFRCAQGTITGLVGPNGAGKTTLLTIAAMRGRASGGHLRFGARNGNQTSLELRARIGWLGHDPGLYPELSARENLRFFADLHGLSDKARRVQAALREAALENRGDDAVAGFSRGMRQRVGLERVLLHEPRLVLLDEPFTGLDESSSRTLVARLASLKRRGCIVLLSTHDLDLVEPLLDRVIVLREGRVVGQLARTTDLAAAVRGLLEKPEAGPAREEEGARTQSIATQPAGPDESFGNALRRFVETAAIVARKDLIVEFRSRELLLTTLFFALSAVLTFAFAFVRDGRPLGDASAGILWVAMTFSGTLALGRTFEREQSHHTLAALLQAPVERAAVYIGKLLGLLGLTTLVLVLAVPLTTLLFQTPLLRQPLALLALLAAGSVGFMAVGSLFAAMLVRTRSRDVLLPVLLYPMTVPVLMGGVRGTVALLEEPADFATFRLWMTILVFFDAVFVTLALWTFDAVTSD
jgi:heme ABC exporter ATP-binding subunit CcmA/heme exporter protein CcmB